jgi:hypothetical protein
MNPRPAMSHLGSLFLRQSESMLIHYLVGGWPSLQTLRRRTLDGYRNENEQATS